MKPAPFRYFRPDSVEAALELLANDGDDFKVLAGGQSLIPMMSLRLARFDGLVDVGRISALEDLRRDDGHLVIGATVRQGRIEFDRDVEKSMPLLQAATKLIGHFQIRNRGTIGGSVCNADPAAEYPAVMRTLGAEMILESQGSTRTVSADEFFLGHWTTAAEPTEMLTSLRIPVPPRDAGWAIDEVARRAGDFAMVGAMCLIPHVEGRIVDPRVCLFGVGSTPVRATRAEQAMVGATITGLDTESVGRLSIEDLEPADDLHASAHYRRTVGAALVKKVMDQALRRAVATEHPSVEGN